MYSVRIESALCGCGEKERSMVRHLKAEILNKWSKAGSPPPSMVLKFLGLFLFFLSCFLFILVLIFVSFLFGFGFGFPS